MGASPCLLIVVSRSFPVVEKRRPLALLGGKLDPDACVHPVDLDGDLAGDPGPVPCPIRQWAEHLGLFRSAHRVVRAR